MRGEILTYDHAAGAGLISGDDGIRYRYSRENLVSGESPARGDQVDFVAEGEVATAVVVLAAYAAQGPSDSRPPVPAMDPWQYFVRCCTTAYFDGEGRARRSEYWSFHLIHLGLVLAAVMVGGMIAVAVSVGSDPGADATPAGIVFGLLGLALILATLYFIIPSVTALIRRLHDMGQSGFWVLLALVPFGSIALFIMSLMPSDPGPNRFGPRPL